MKRLLPAMSLILLAAISGLPAMDFTLVSLKCLDTEDSLGSDECELRVSVDGQAAEKLRKDLNDGQSWSVGKTWPWTKSVKVELWDLDSPDPNDFLGTLSVNAAGYREWQGIRVAAISGSGWKYELRYSLSGKLPTSPVEVALFRVRQFRESPRRGVFTKIGKGALCDDLAFIVQNPHRIAQPDQGLCGPNAILYLLAKRDPELYVTMARALWEDGTWRMPGGKSLTPGAHLLTASVPAKYRAADWMMGATMRDAENAIFDYDEGDDFAAITNFGEMAEWMKQLLGCKRVEIDHTILGGENDALIEASRAIATGNVAVLCVDSTRLPGQKPSAINIPRHWVVLLQVYHDVPLFSFRLWTWGRDEYDPKSSISGIAEGDFEDLMWGTVVGYF